MKNINLINKIYNLPLSNYLTGFIKKKLLKNNDIIFIPTKLKRLPRNNHPIQNSIGLQENIIENYNKYNKLSFNTFPKIKLLLKKKFKTGESFNFLDFGGDKLDFYLDLSKEFKNINYFLMNLPEVNKIIDTFKKKYDYQNLTILNNLKEIQKYQYDFVYCGSTLQYLNDYNNFILKILPITKKNIMFTATHFFSDNDRFDHIVAKQLNFLPKLYYLYFFNLDNFSKKLKEYHFNIEFNCKNESHDIKYDSFKYLNIKNIKYTDILFSKNKKK